MSSNDIQIIGGDGFLGTRLTDRLLAARPKVLIYDKFPSAAHPQLSIPGDVRDSEALTRSRSWGLRLPKQVRLILGSAFDLLARFFGRKFPISPTRVEKFCANTHFDSACIVKVGFTPEVDIRNAPRRTVVAKFGSFDNSGK